MRSTRSLHRDFLKWSEQGRQAADWSEWWLKTSLSRLGSSESITVIRYLSEPAVPSEKNILQFGRHIRSTTKDRREYSFRMWAFGTYISAYTCFLWSAVKGKMFLSCCACLEKVWEGVDLPGYIDVAYWWNIKQERGKWGISVQSFLWESWLRLTLLYYKSNFCSKSQCGNICALFMLD